MRNIGCTLKQLPDHEPTILAAAQRAIGINPANGLMREMLAGLEESPVMTPYHLAVMTGKRWPVAGVKLTVGFFGNPTAATQRMVLEQANRWNKTANVEFVQTANVEDAQVRVSFERTGYWSYLGTDILGIPKNEATLNLEDFTAATPWSEWLRVPPHEFGHSLGFPHEHMRSALVARLDPQKTIAYFWRTQRWTARETKAQVLTPVSEASLFGTPEADARSIMCYMLPGEITRDGQPIAGGADIDERDFEFVAKIYPKAAPPEPPTPPIVVPPPAASSLLITATDESGVVKYRGSISAV
jgi:hypothetical protein